MTIFMLLSRGAFIIHGAVSCLAETDASELYIKSPLSVYLPQRQLFLTVGIQPDYYFPFTVAIYGGINIYKCIFC